VIYYLAAFAPTSAEDFAEAQRVLAQIRIPHHAVISRWFDGIALLQVLWIGLALFLVRNNKLFLVIAIPFLASLVLTLVQFATENNTLALLFPWRTSAFLVPLATTINLTRLVTYFFGERPEPQNTVLSACYFVLAAYVVGGLAVPFFELGYRNNRDELPLLEFVKNNHQPGAVYLIPVEIPGKGRPGAASTNFMPEPRLGKSNNLIAIDLQRFRLFTGTPIYVDFKSIPYKEEEVLEWYRRVLWCMKVYGQPILPVEVLRANLKERKITHVVVPANKVSAFAGLGTPVYEDKVYCVFPVTPK